MVTPVALFLTAGLSFPVMNGDKAEVFNTETQPTGVFVIESFFNNCPACNANEPNVAALQKAYELDPQVKVISASTDQDDESYAEWIGKHHPAKGTVVKDEMRAFVKAEKIKYVPTVTVKDCHLVTVHKYTGIWTTKEKQALVDVIEATKAACQTSELK